MKGKQVYLRRSDRDEIPPGTFHGGDEIPPTSSSSKSSLTTTGGSTLSIKPIMARVIPACKSPIDFAIVTGGTMSVGLETRGTWRRPRKLLRFGQTVPSVISEPAAISEMHVSW
jgi:hypothetical protein